MPLGPLQLKNPPPISSLTLLLLACAAGQTGARPAVYVRGIIRISYGRGRRGGGLKGEISSRGGVQIDGRERKGKGGWEKIGGLPETCLKIKVLSWPRLIFHRAPKLKM